MNVKKRDILIEIYQAAIAAVRPDKAVLRQFGLKNGVIVVDGEEIMQQPERIFVVGAGKGAAPMALAVESLLPGKIDAGVVVVKYGHFEKTGKIRIMEAAHPVPDAAGAAGADAILELACQCGPRDILICLFTGGASALLPVPAAGVTLAELGRATSLLLESGADIHELNAVRKHLSRLGGGQLARAAGDAHIVSLIVSDVIGDNLDVIASGPTAPDPTTFADCLAILAKYGLVRAMPESVMRHLEAGAAGSMPETPKPDDALFVNVKNIVVAGNAMALAAAAEKAEALGFRAVVEPAAMRGEAREMAALLVAKAEKLADGMRPGDVPVCLLAGGETTVALKGTGLGGRNQEMALAASLLLSGKPGIAALFAGTDGSDGPTEAAGGFAFAGTAGRMCGRGEEYLADNDSFHALEQAGDLFVTGPTLTNVMDLAIILIEAPAAQNHSRM